MAFWRQEAEPEAEVDEDASHEVLCTETSDRLVERSESLTGRHVA